MFLLHYFATSSAAPSIPAILVFTRVPGWSNPSPDGIPPESTMEALLVSATQALFHEIAGLRQFSKKR